MSTGNRVIFALSLIGLVISGYLAFEYSQIEPIGCPIGAGCEIVRKSEFSKMFGVDLPIFGVAFYLSLAFLSVWLAQSFTKSINTFRFLISFAGFIFGLYLTFIEAFVIQAWCIWCLASFIVSLLIFLICLKEVFAKNN